MSAQSIKIDDLPIGRFHLKIAGLTFGAHFTDGYILGLIGIAFTLLSPQMQLDAFWQGLIGASALIGLFLGSLFFGWISRQGRAAENLPGQFCPDHPCFGHAVLRRNGDAVIPLSGDNRHRTGRRLQRRPRNARRILAQKTPGRVAGFIQRYLDFWLCCRDLRRHRHAPSRR